ncbi:MAG: sodium:alanine symporter family protein [Lachnospiraceae bacterium]|nr:sodium:alanine symporter family protein [Lachnospiraceae bacterium]
MERFAEIISKVDDFVWGPVMLVLLVGTGVFLTFRLGFASFRNLGYALRLTLSKESRKKGKGTGDISPFSALTTALAATIGTGNIVGVATAMVSGGPGALVWMWLSAAFGMTSKFSECMLAIKYREVNEKGEMSGGPMYTMKKAFKNKRAGEVLGWLFALFAVVASFGIGNLTQANSISDALSSTFKIPTWISGAALTVLALAIIVGGIKSISKVSSVVVPVMAIFYVICGLVVILGNIKNVPEGLAMIFRMAFSLEAAGGGLCGTVTAAMMNSMRFGVARGVFSNEAGMGSAAITAAAAVTDNPVRQGYINMTGTFWDTIVVCSITGICIAASGVLGSTTPQVQGKYAYSENQAVIVAKDSYGMDAGGNYEILFDDDSMSLTKEGDALVLYPMDEKENCRTERTLGTLTGAWTDEAGNHYIFREDGTYEMRVLVKGAALTILAFESVLGTAGGWLICIGISLFAFSTILGWEYHGEKAFEYLLGTHKFNMVYRIFFSLIAYVGATTALDVVWNFSDIANALMAVPNLICLLALSGEIAKDVKEFQAVIRQERMK